MLSWFNENLIDLMVEIEMCSINVYEDEWMLVFIYVLDCLRLNGLLICICDELLILVIVEYLFFIVY